MSTGASEEAALEPATGEVPIPALLGRYRPVSIVGHGGMATVYRAVDETLGREVAIKVFRTGAEADLTRHQEETRVLAGLSHHGLVTLIDAGIDDSAPGERHPFLVMEMVEGTDLQEALALRTFNPREISEIAYDIAEALEFVHAHGVVHRDIKPSNILLVEYGTSTFRTRARLTDFGIAIDAESERLTTDGGTTGTAAYLSPEQASRADVTAATDVYSLGLVLLQCFTNELAFPGDDVVEAALARLSADPRIPDDLPGDWTVILRGMLARDPADRPEVAELTVKFRQAVIAASSRHATGEAGGDETARLDAVARYAILDTPPEGAFDRVTSIAARALGVPIAMISILASDRLWFKARHGTDLPQLQLLPEISAQVASYRETWVVPDTTQHETLRTHPLVTGDMGVRAAAGAPIIDPNGMLIGMLLAIDTQPREFDADAVATLDDLAAIVVSELVARLD